MLLCILYTALLGTSISGFRRLRQAANFRKAATKAPFGAPPRSLEGSDQRQACWTPEPPSYGHFSHVKSLKTGEIDDKPLDSEGFWGLCSSFRQTGRSWTAKLTEREPVEATSHLPIRSPQHQKIIRLVIGQNRDMFNIVQFNLIILDNRIPPGKN